jgi:tetratricopeptide (TPR) repeat protein
MPKYAAVDVTHAASTDHRILRQARIPAEPRGNAGDKSSSSLVHFHRKQADAPAGPLRRDLAFAQIELSLVHRKQSAPLGNVVYSLEEQLWNHPRDWPAWEEKAKALELMGRKHEALQDLEVVLAQFPERETALLRAATLARDLGLMETAIASWQKLIGLNPGLAEPRAKLTSVFIGKKAWEQALPYARDWSRLDPASINARLAYAECLVQTGHADQARREFAVIEGLRPGATKGRKEKARGG